MLYKTKLENISIKLATTIITHTHKAKMTSTAKATVAMTTTATVEATKKNIIK